MTRLIALSTFCAVASFAQTQIGTPVADFSVTAPDGSEASFAQLRGGVTVVAFISSLCPISNAYNDRMSALYKEYVPKGVKFVILNANANESAADIAAHAKSAGFPFPVYRDVRNRAADLFGAMATPETYVIDSAGVLRYHGYIDDSPNPARVKNAGLRTALDAVLSGQEVHRAETKAFGCTIKRVRRSS